MKILITRPKAFNDLLAEKLIALKHDVVSLPMTEIKPIAPLNPMAIETLKTLSLHDIIIFSSQPAVHFGIRWIKQYQPDFPPPSTWIAMGPSTANALYQYGILNVIYGQTPPYGSESLLALPLFHAPNTYPAQKIVLIKGVDGRTYLAENLEKKGFLISTVDVYEREKPEITPDFMKKLQNFINDKTQPKVIISTSLDGLKHLVSIKNDPKIKTIPLIVVGQRMQSFANDWGFKNVLLATSATDPSIIKTVQTFEG